MKTSTTAQNQNSQQGGRDLGQISIKTRFLKSGDIYEGWWAEVMNKDRHEVTFWEGHTAPSKADLIAWGHEWEEGFATLPVRTWRLAAALADLTSKSKGDRDYAKSNIREWAAIGAAVHSLAMAAIEQAKEAPENLDGQGV